MFHLPDMVKKPFTVLIRGSTYMMWLITQSIPSLLKGLTAVKSQDCTLRRKNLNLPFT